MGQRNIYLPTDLEKEIEKRAKKEKKSVSALVVELIQNQIKPPQFSPEFWKVVGSLDDPSFKKHDAGRIEDDSKRETF